MIPIILLLGFVIGRWWIVPLAVVVWAALVLPGNTIDAAEISAVAGLTAANAAVGVGTRQALSVLFRSARDIVCLVRRRRPSTSA